MTAASVQRIVELTLNKQYSLLSSKFFPESQFTTRNPIYCLYTDLNIVDIYFSRKLFFLKIAPGPERWFLNWESTEALVENWAFIPSTHLVTENHLYSSSRGSNPASGLHRLHAHGAQTYMQAKHPCTENKNKSHKVTKGTVPILQRMDCPVAKPKDCR